MGLIDTSQQPIASYTYAEMLSGTGWVNFYAAKGGTTPSLILSPVVTYSTPNITTDSTGTIGTRIDNDFDMRLNKPMSIYGRTIIGVPIKVISSSTPASVYAKVLLRKWDGSTETEIANGQSADWSPTSTGTEYKMLCVIIDVSTEALIKAKEYLRVTVQLYQYTTSTTTIGFAHNPLGTTTDWDASGAVTSQLLIPIPTRIRT